MQKKHYNLLYMKLLGMCQKFYFYQLSGIYLK